MPELIIMRGIPGSGKTTTAEKFFSDYIYVDADTWRMTKDGYAWTPDENAKAHAWCRLEVERLMRLGKDIIVANTFIKTWEYKEYLDLASKYVYNTRIFVANGRYQNTHGVPDEKVEKMRQEFEW